MFNVSDYSVYGDSAIHVMLSEKQRAYLSSAMATMLKRMAWQPMADNSWDTLGKEIADTLLAIDTEIETESETSLVTGMIIAYADDTPPTGYLLCDGSAVSRTTYADLYALVGTTYGAGDNSTTFNLPDLRGRTIVGVGQGSGLSNRLLAQSFGTETHALTDGEMSANAAIWGGNGVAPLGGGFGFIISRTTSAHNNIQPSIALSYIIKT